MVHSFTCINCGHKFWPSDPCCSDPLSPKDALGKMNSLMDRLDGLIKDVQMWKANADAGGARAKELAEQIKDAGGDGRYNDT